jgi:hypothetical protein
MAKIANTFNTYETVGRREELSDAIYMISPEETPFISNAGKGSVTNTFFEYQQDALSAPDGANAQLEGDDQTTFDAVVPTIRPGNYVQISRKSVIISGTQEATTKAGRKSEKAYQLAKKSAELKRDMETILLSNQGAIAGATATARKTAGLPAWVKTNTDKGAAGVDPVYTVLPSVARTDGTQRAFTETQLKNVIQLGWVQGANVDTVMVGGTQKQAMSGFAGIATKTYNSTKAAPMTIIGAADVYVSDFGTLSIVPNRFQRARDAWTLDFEMIDVVYLRKFFNKPLAPTGDAEKSLLLVEYGLKVKQEAGLGLIADLS